MIGSVTFKWIRLKKYKNGSNYVFTFTPMSRGKFKIEKINVKNGKV